MAIIGLRQIKVIRQALDGGYVAHTLSQSKLDSVNLEAWAHWFHRPYEKDFGYATARAIGRERRTKNEPNYTV